MIEDDVEAMEGWEVVAAWDGDHTVRRRVPGGWLYRTLFYTPGVSQAPRAVAMVFVPLSPNWKEE